MHWAYEAANILLNNYPDRLELTCASGVSPSGYIHVGNFREVVTTYFVTEALKDLGGNPRFILSWDDYDRLRKIPANVSGVNEDQIGRPYTKVPYAFNEEESYGAFFEKTFEADLEKMGITPEYIYETQRYESGVYDEYIIKAMEQRREIYDILENFRTEKSNEEAREKYYPISLYCDTCGHDSTTITNYDERTKKIDYTCHFGHTGSQVIGQKQKVKLHWKVDWPMRWKFEEVVFEPGGKDHSSKNGSFDVAKMVAKNVFDYTAPSYEPYDFINIKGQTQKMSSSAGNIITLTDLLAIYTPELIFYLYAKYLPKAQFDIGLDTDVLKNYTEFERKVSQSRENPDQDELTAQMIKLTKINLQKNYPSFSHTVSILSLTNNDQQMAKAILLKEAPYTSEELDHIVPRAAYWIENDADNHLLTIQTEQDHVYYDSLSQEIKETLNTLAEILKNNPGLTGDELMQTVYDLVKSEDKQERRAKQKELFQAIYQLTLKKNSGPRIPLLIQVIGRPHFIELICN